ncbi:RPA-C domain-containing protein [Mycena chlorophos]|uniref:RPA-C domain-containing protein n=1 Tax=Mycena chlorophos TaxID=658473 RepID=A0A8H6TQ01_MYCCL|nr:RPA-C domain-containing protein [Mycena chlorophos]
MSQYSPSGGGGFSGSQGGGSPGQKASQTIRPVTIAQLRKATQMHSDADWKLGENSIGQIKLVAEVRDHRVQNTHRSFLLDDGTGTINGKLWVDTQQEDYEEPFRGIPVNQIAHFRITGNLRSHSGKRYIQISNMRLVKDMNEIYYHIMETIYVHVVIQKGLPSSFAGGGQAQGTSAGTTGGGQGAYMVQSRPTGQQKLFSRLADQVANYLATTPNETGEGASVGDIARALKCDPMQLSETVERMIDEGHVYTTIDESHIQLAS